MGVQSTRFALSLSQRTIPIPIPTSELCHNATAVRAPTLRSTRDAVPAVTRGAVPGTMCDVVPHATHPSRFILLQCRHDSGPHDVQHDEFLGAAHPQV